MLSIVVCSKEQKLFEQLKVNLDDTIGVEYEIIQINNVNNRMGICEAYNIGASQAKFPYLCFIHEDIKFITNKWGGNLLEHFRNDLNTGVIGIAGSNYKVKMLSSWWQPTILEIEPKRTNYIQFYPKSNTKKHLFQNPLGEIQSIVATLDGVFLAMRKSVWEQILFDQELLKGFHGYDIDFTLRAGVRFNNYVVYDILFEHFSEGHADLNWFIQNFLVHRKNKNLLPVIKSSVINKNNLRWVDKVYLERNLSYVSKWQINRLKTIFIFVQLILNSKLFKPNRFFLKNLFKELLK